MAKDRINTSTDLKTVGADADGLFPMRLVTRLTGLSADTIRAWERRYGAVTPDRSAGNTRRFSSEDIRRLTLLREAVERGHAIGSIATLPTEQVASLFQTEGADTQVENPPETGFEQWREGYLTAVSRFDLRHSYDLLARAGTLLDRETFLFDVVVPLVQAVGDRWATDRMSIAEEHIVSRQLTALLDEMLDARTVPAGSPKILMTTPPGHRHEFGVLVAALLAATRGIEPIYMGADLPFEELSWAVRKCGASVLLMGVSRDLSPEERLPLPKQLELVANWTQLWIGAPSGHELIERVPSARFFHRYEDFDDALGEL